MRVEGEGNLKKYISNRFFLPDVEEEEERTFSNLILLGLGDNNPAMIL